MPQIKKFDGYLVNPEKVAAIVTPAYDGMLPAQRRMFAHENPGNFVNAMRSLEEFDSNPPSLSEVLAHNQQHLNELLHNGSFRKISSPAYYLYRLQEGSHVQTGVIADIPVTEYVEGRLKKHEHTQLEKESMLTSYHEVVGATSSPICVAHSESDLIASAIDEAAKQQPYLQFSAWDDVVQTVWRVDDPSIAQQIENGFQEIEFTYLTDGHHRCASTAKYSQTVNAKGKRNVNLLVALFPQSQMRIFSYFRCVRDLNNMNEGELVTAIEAQGIQVNNKSDEVTNGILPNREREITMLVDGNVYGLYIPSDLVPKDPVQALDVSLLQDKVLSPILGIQDARSDSRLSYLPGVDGAPALMQQCKNGWRVGFACFNTTIEQMIEVADAGQVMPPKSTWFDPKLRAGIFLRYC